MRSRLRAMRSEEGLTLIELLISASMGVVVMGAVTMLVIGALKTQPRISQQTQNVSTARWVLDRFTHEVRNGIAITKAEPNSVSFEAYVRHSTCGGSATLPSTSKAIRCQITYTCTATACSRAESAPLTYNGTPKQIFKGIDSSNVFEYLPDKEEPTYVKVTLHLPGPKGSPALTVSDGTSLRNATLGY